MKTNGKNKSAEPGKELTAWIQSPHIIRVPSNEEEYDELVAILDHLLDTTDINDDTPAAALVDVIGTLIEQYEDVHVPELASVSQPKSVRRIPKPKPRKKVVS
jgi:HTH-type transcriptional regulator/antitoxin HigA